MPDPHPFVPDIFSPGSPATFLPLLFPRLLGVVYFIAFASLLVQVAGLFGTRGILPVAAYLPELRRALGNKAYRICPTLFWLNSSDRALTGGSLLGMLLSVTLLAGAPAAPLLLLLWLLYLSFVSIGQEFLSYQWDSLLLEVGFMTIFLPLAPAGAPLVMFAYRFFLFRFMFSSGAVKVLSGDPTWRDLTALCHHYRTQPLPNRVGWYAHHLPVPLQKFSTFATLFIEIAIPFLAFGPAPARLCCLALLLFLQVLIFATGSYGFFNILAVLLTVTLLDDAVLGIPPPLALSGHQPFWHPAVTAVFAAFLALNLLQLLALFYHPYWLRRLFGILSPFMISNHYGLFAVMTTDRLEFEIEGSNDGKNWLSYEFRYKPGRVECAPKQAAPHQPRLDWQMWFAALDPRSVEAWFASLIVRLMEGSPPVLKLLKRNPFPEAPPSQVRLSVYRYRFASLSERRSNRIWWERSLVVRYKPVQLQRPG